MHDFGYITYSSCTPVFASLKRDYIRATPQSLVLQIKWDNPVELRYTVKAHQCWLLALEAIVKLKRITTITITTITVIVPVARVLNAGSCRSVVSDLLWPHELQSARLLCSWGFSRQECWSDLPCPSPGVLPNPGIKPRSCRWILYCLSHQGSPYRHCDR